MVNEEFSISTSQHREMIDITKMVNEFIKEKKVTSGLCNVFTRHATAAIIINENYDPNICTDVLNALEKVLPDNAGYLHDKVDGNAGSHIKAATLGPSETMPIVDGRLHLGTWQAVMLVELDGPKKRTISVQILSA